MAWAIKNFLTGTCTNISQNEKRCTIKDIKFTDILRPSHCYWYTTSENSKFNISFLYSVRGVPEKCFVNINANQLSNPGSKYLIFSMSILKSLSTRTSFFNCILYEAEFQIICNLQQKRSIKEKLQLICLDLSSCRKWYLWIETCAKVVWVMYINVNAFLTPNMQTCSRSINRNFIQRHLLPVIILYLLSFWYHVKIWLDLKFSLV